MPVDVRVLGGIEVVGDDGLIRVGARQQRRLLAALAAHRGGTCSTDVLIEALWGKRPPRSAEKVLQVYVSRLRKALPAPARIRTGGGGYALELAEDSFDATRFERLLGEGREAIREGNPPLALSLCRRALAFWRGPAYGEFAYEDFARAEAERLEELRLVALEDRIAAELALGRHARALPELRALAATQPLRERLQALAMLALYRCGRQSEALELYAATRARLRDELGLEPGVELRGLQRRILQHDPELAPPTPAEGLAGRLPTAPNRLLGRGCELTELRELLARSDMRLLVLTGAGGSGKTRLALEVAHECASSFANGAAFVDLAPLRDPDHVPEAIARALGVLKHAGESPETLAAALAPRELLLLLDNAEHLRAAAPGFVELLAGAPRLTLLVTSRVVLHLSGEHVYPVQPLREHDAVALFIERAREADPRFHPTPADERAIQRICTRVDGLPLAIELAASRSRTLTPVELLERLDPRLPLLTGGPRDLPARQQTLRATLDWTLDLLDEQERRDLDGLSVFAGGCTLEAAEAVADTTLDRLATLVDHNILQHTASGDGSRYTMLETIREYARERLDVSDRAEEVGRRHVDYFIRITEDVAKVFENEDEPLQGPDFKRLRERVKAEGDNFRAALAWAIEHGERERALRLASPPATVFFFAGTVSEARRALEAALAVDGTSIPAVEAKALQRAASLAREDRDFQSAALLAEKSVALFRTTGEFKPLAYALQDLGIVLQTQGRRERARRALEESMALFRRLSRGFGYAKALHCLGELERDAGRLESAAELLSESLDLHLRGGRLRLASFVRHGLADLRLEQGDLDDAARLYRESLVQFHNEGDARSIAFCIGGLAAAAAASGDVQRAGRLWAVVEHWEETRGALLEESERHRYEHRLDALDQEALARAIEDGRSMTLDETVEYALSPN